VGISTLSSALGVLVYGIVVFQAESAAGEAERLTEESVYNANMCGVYSLYITLRLYDIDCELEELKELAKFDPEHGTSSKNLCLAARAKGLNLRTVKLEDVGQLRRFRPPIIIHYKSGHFAVIYELGPEHFGIMDPPTGAFQDDIGVFRSDWSGVALVQSSAVRERLIHFLFAVSAVSLVTLIFGYFCGKRNRAVRTLPIMLLGFLIGCSNSSRPSGVPQQKLEKADGSVVYSHDFGLLDAEKPATHTFAIKNEGPHIWKITQVKSSCSCTVGRIEKKTVPPGEEMEVVVTVWPKSEVRPQNHQIAVRTASADPGLILINISLRGNILVEYVPNALVLRSAAGKTCKAELSVYLADEIWKTYEISNWSASQAFVAVSNITRLENKVILEVTLRDTAPVGTTAGKLTITSSLSRVPIADIPYSVYVEPGFDVIPSRLILTKKLESRMAEYWIEVRRRAKDVDAEIGTVTTELPEVEVRQVLKAEEGVWRICLRVDPQNVTTHASGWVRIKTSLPQEPEIRIPVVLRSRLHS